MTRWTSSALEAAAELPTVVPVVFVDLDIVGDRQRLNDSNITINWGGFDWSGVGTYGGIEVVSEGQDLIAQPVRLTLSGVESNLVTDARTTQYQGRDVVIYVGLLNTDTLALIDTPEEVWSGFMDVMRLEADHGVGRITLTCEHWLRVDPAASRYTDEQQQANYAGDRFFQFTHEIPGYVGKWGARDVGYGGGTGGRDHSPGPRNPRQEF